MQTFDATLTEVVRCMNRVNRTDRGELVVGTTTSTLLS